MYFIFSLSISDFSNKAIPRIYQSPLVQIDFMKVNLKEYVHFKYKHMYIVLYIYLVQKETQCFYLYLLGLKIIVFKNCFKSVVLPSNKEIDCIVSS